MLEKYVQMFAHLRTDRGRDRYPAITYHRAPHKPFLLLSVMELIAQGRITSSLIEPSYDLVEKDEAPVSRRAARVGPRQKPGVTLEKEKNGFKRRLRPAFSPSKWTF
jgi:hypothetical protein